MVTTMLHLRITKDDAETLDELAVGTFSRNQIGSMILSAALAAVRESHGRLSFPPYFTVGIHDKRSLALNESPPRIKK
jgi:hypothetical protein